MNPLLFGTSKEPLFGVYHPPSTSRTPGRGVVLCAPIGVEYMRTHRAVQKLAMQLARAGVHVFRFDYFGTGDSAGGSDAGTPSRWVQDIVLAAEELREHARIKAVSLAGLRAGATLAAAAAREIGRLDRMVLWDPVVDGAAYVTEQLAQATPGPGKDAVGVHGFPFPVRVQEELRALDLTRLLFAGMAADTLLVISHDAVSYRTLSAAAAQQGVAMTTRQIPSSGDWDDLDRLGAALMPQQIIRGIVSWMAEEETP